MDWSKGSDRIVEGALTDPVQGCVRWKPVKSIWIGAMTLTALIAGPLLFTWDAFAVFVIGCAITLCTGHSVGMHRRLIHNSFECPLWLEYAMVYSGVLVGMAGPFGLMHQHDLRDWAQRQRNCHDYLKHGRSFWLDAWWQLHCDLKLARIRRAFSPRGVLPTIACIFGWNARGCGSSYPSRSFCLPLAAGAGLCGALLHA